MTAPVDVVNMALADIGARTLVQSINPSDGSQAGDIASLLYQPKMDALGRSAHWNCLRMQALGTLIKARKGTPENPSGALPEPPQPWLYGYQFPTDCLKVRFLLPPLVPQSDGAAPFMTNIGMNMGTLAFSQRIAVPYIVSSDLDPSNNPITIILTNLSQASLVYTKRIVDPTLWDSMLLSAASATLGAFFVNPLNRNEKLLTQQFGLAKSLIESARISDGNEGITSSDFLPDWIAVRGCGWVNPVGYSYFAPWDTMAFPGGFV